MWYWVVRIAAIALFKVFFRLKVEGRENLYRKSNYIIIANHASFFDPFVLSAAIPGKIHYLASRELYKVPFVKWVLHRLEATPTGSSSEKAVQYLLDGKNVGLFPEGGCSRDGRMREFRRGAALLAHKTGRPIIPCAILGTFEALPVKAKWPKFITIKVKIGTPICLLKEYDDCIDDIFLQEGTFRIRKAVKELVDAG
jgi:1-acyl-sn-glycerol-3-phosphate acyltransferase